MPRRSSSTARRRAARPLDRARVLTAAFALIDCEGVEAVSMRRLADRLGVSPMALYNHVSDKDDLLRGVAARMLAEADFSCGAGDWRERIRVCFHRLRDVCLAHPGAVRLLETIDEAPPAVFGPLEITLAALEEIGLTGTAAMRGYCLLSGFTMGHVAYETRSSPGLDPARALARGELQGTHIARAFTAEPWDFDAAFAFGLGVILDGLAQVACAASQVERATSRRSTTDRIK